MGAIKVIYNSKDRIEALTKEGACIKFYDETGTLYSKTNASCVGLGAGLLQIREGN